MRAHGVLGDIEPRRDLVGAEMLVEQQQDLDLAGRELSRDLVRYPAHAPAFTNTVEQAAGDRAREGRLTVGDATKEQGDALRRLALQEVAGGTGSDGLEEVLVRTGRCEHDDLALGRGLANVWDGAQAVHAGHGQIEEHESRAQPSGLLDRFLSVGRLPDDVEAVLSQQRRKGLSREGVIVRDQDARHTVLIGSRPSAD